MYTYNNINNSGVLKDNRHNEIILKFRQFQYVFTFR